MELYAFDIHQITVVKVTIIKLGGAGNIVDKTKPSQIEHKQISIATSIALNAVLVKLLAAAAGVMIRAKISNVPTAGTAMVITPDNNTIKAIFIQKMGTPFACATCSSNELNNRGR